MIEVRDVRKSFGSQAVLKGASLQINAGEAVVIIGRSGGGKAFSSSTSLVYCHPTKDRSWWVELI